MGKDPGSSYVGQPYGNPKMAQALASGNMDQNLLSVELGCACNKPSTLFRFFFLVGKQIGAPAIGTHSRIAHSAWFEGKLTRPEPFSGVSYWDTYPNYTKLWGENDMGMGQN